MCMCVCVCVCVCVHPCMAMPCVDLCPSSLLVVPSCCPFLLSLLVVPFCPFLLRFIDRDELHRMLQVELCEPITEKALDEAMEMLDENGDGQIEFEEMLHWFALEFIPGRGTTQREQLLRLKLRAGRVYWRMRQWMSWKDRMAERYKEWRKERATRVPGRSSAHIIDIESYVDQSERT